MFKIKLEVSDFVEVNGEYKRVTANKKFSCTNWDDLQNLFSTLVDASDGDVVLTISKTEEE